MLRRTSLLLAAALLVRKTAEGLAFDFVSRHNREESNA